MKATLTIIWKLYSIAGAIWLSFTILSLGFLHRQEKEEVEGTIVEMIITEWDGVSEAHAVIETEDKKGNVLAKLYKPGVGTNDSVTVKLSTNKDRSYLHASVMN